MNENVYVYSENPPEKLEESVRDLDVQGLYMELSNKILGFRAWFFPSSEILVRTSAPAEGPLVIHIFDFRVSPHASVRITRNQIGVLVIYDDLRFTETQVKVLLKAVLKMHKKMPPYDPNETKAPPGFCAEKE